jgi:putative oxidoreductase
MFTILRNHESRIIAVTRILLGVMLACHGAQKVLGAFEGPAPGTPSFVVWGAGPIELVGGSFIAVGLFTLTASFLTSGLMAAAYFIAHAPKGFWPILNGGELAITFCWLSLYLAAHGPGAWAVDNLRGRARRDEGLTLAASTLAQPEKG